jgi:hypothetical protein
MDPEGRLTNWAAQMAARHGPKVMLHGVTYPWLAALGVARFGEDPTAVHPKGHPRAVDAKGKPKAGVPVWPAAFSADDIIRAKRWLYENNVPDGITYITLEG